jgi:hypothetical protein
LSFELFDFLGRAEVDDYFSKGFSGEPRSDSEGKRPESELSFVDEEEYDREEEEEDKGEGKLDQVESTQGAEGKERVDGGEGRDR